MFQTQGLQKQGTVIVHLDLTPEGAVKRTKVIAGDAELRSIVIESARNWRFVRVPDLPASLDAYVYFVENDGSRWGPPPPPPPPPFGAAASTILIEGLPNADRERLLQAIGLKIGDPVTEQSFDKARSEARKFNPPMSFRMRLGARGNLLLHFERSFR